MKKLTILLAVMATVLFTFAKPAAATIIQADDAVFGADAIIRDLDNNSDFLRLDLTMGYGYIGIIGELTGGAFDGWSVASLADMDLLGVSAGIVHGSTDTGILALAEELRDWFCPAATCVNLSSTHEYARGLISDTNSDGQQLAFSIGRRFNVDPHAVDFRVSGHDYDRTNEEVFMVRSTATVPEPSTILLLGSGLIGLAFFRRKTKIA